MASWQSQPVGTTASEQIKLQSSILQIALSNPAPTISQTHDANLFVFHVTFLNIKNLTIGFCHTLPKKPRVVDKLLHLSQSIAAFPSRSPHQVCPVFPLRSTP